MLLYRIANRRYIDELKGEGARLYGGRWNAAGLPVIYTSSHISLAVLEIIANTSLFHLPKHMQLLTLEVSNNATNEEFKQKNLPLDWKEFPSNTSTHLIGDRWLIEKRSLLLKVPSVIITTEHNWLINPLHTEMKKVKIKKIEDFPIDERVLQNLKQ
ncbi:MAG: RES family NAD+ phosphorylase [Chitinophagales bacterium]|nr:RES family NAD+ phosphorylase [Chitinophagales bacterium]